MATMSWSSSTNHSVRKFTQWKSVRYQNFFTYLFMCFGLKYVLLWHATKCCYCLESLHSKIWKMTNNLVAVCVECNKPMPTKSSNVQDLTDAPWNMKSEIRAVKVGWFTDLMAVFVHTVAIVFGHVRNTDRNDQYFIWWNLVHPLPGRLYLNSK